MGLINYRELSRLITGKPETIRETNIPKKHSKAIDELKAFVEYWIKKYIK